MFKSSLLLILTFMESSSTARDPAVLKCIAGSAGNPRALSCGASAAVASAANVGLTHAVSYGVSQLRLGVPQPEK